MSSTLDTIHARVRAMPAFQRLAIISRILLGLAFIPTGLVKLLGNRFTTLGVDNPVGAFFEAMFQTGIYWNFIGSAQVLAGVMLLIPITRTLGAIAFFPIILNVTVITWSIGFTGTKYITLMMLLASVFLLCWDYHRLKSIFGSPSDRSFDPVKSPVQPIEKAGYILGTGAAMVVLSAARGLFPMSVVFWMMVLAAIAIVMVLIGWIQAGRKPSPTAFEN